MRDSYVADDIRVRRSVLRVLQNSLVVATEAQDGARLESEEEPPNV